MKLIRSKSLPTTNLGSEGEDPGLVAYNLGKYQIALSLWLPRSGESEVQFNLGTMHADGRGVPQNYAEAMKWFGLAADQGDADAQTYLGIMYDNGEGVPQNYVLAHKWFNLASASGHANGVRGRNLVASKMTPAQIAEAQRLAAEWKPKPPQIAEAQRLAGDCKQNGNQFRIMNDEQRLGTAPPFNRDLLRKVVELELSVRIMNFLIKDKIIYIGDLVQKSEWDVLRAVNFDRKSLDEIKEALAPMALLLGMANTGWPPENIEVEIPESDEAQLLSRDRADAAGSASVPQEELSEAEKEQIDCVAVIPAKTWFDLATWAKETQMLQAWERKLSFSLGKLADGGKKPTRKQAKHGLRIIEEAHSLGYESDLEVSIIADGGKKPTRKQAKHGLRIIEEAQSVGYEADLEASITRDYPLPSVTRLRMNPVNRSIITRMTMMNINDSFLVTPRPKNVSVFVSKNAKDLNRTFITAKEDDGIRIWRTS